MPGVIAFLLPSQFLRKVPGDGSLVGAIPMPVVMKTGQPIGVYFADPGQVTDQFAGAVKWNLPKAAELKVVCGAGIAVSTCDANPVLSAEKDGALVASESSLKISDVFEVHGDLDKRTGNIETGLPVLIHGVVSHGVTISSKGDVEIRGLVEDSVIKADGNITAKGGVAGGGSGRLSAGKDVYCQFAQNATIEGGGNVTIGSYLMNSTVLCGKKLLLRDGAFMVGGKAIAFEGMEAARIGSEAAVASEIEVGKNPFLKVQFENAAKNLEKVERELAVLRTAAQHCEFELSGLVHLDEQDLVTSLFSAAEAVKREGQNLDEEKIILCEKFGGGIMDMMQKNEDYKIEKITLEGLGKSGSNNFLATARLVVTGVAHPGALIRMGDAMLKLDREYDQAEFWYKPAGGDRKVGEIAVK
ncbi:MAG: DUF342 domain-containing protein [Nitrospinae bacterium]|nr:DUF342 domain-containing protein [Nitrospinota bacterium]